MNAEEARKLTKHYHCFDAPKRIEEFLKSSKTKINLLARRGYSLAYLSIPDELLGVKGGVDKIIEFLTLDGFKTEIDEDNSLKISW